MATRLQGLDRFVDAQAGTYATALAEIRAGAKRSHWMWFIFPQLAGLGRSRTARVYAIADLEEARAYLAHPVLGPRLDEISTAMLSHAGQPAARVLGTIDAMKLRSSATLFDTAGEGIGPYAQLLDTFFDGLRCPLTLRLLDER